MEGLFLAFHHLVIDAVSWRILAEDLARVSRGEPLPAKGSSYRQWGEGLAAYAKREEEQLGFWLAQGKAARVTCWKRRAPPMAAPPPACCN